MNKAEELEHFRKLLRRIQERVRDDVEHMEEEVLCERGGDHGSSNHMAEMGSDAWNQDFSLSMVEMDEESLKEISAALKRIDDGTFGICERCIEEGKPASKSRIPKARLNALPYARNCVECERKREHEQ